MKTPAFGPWRGNIRLARAGASWLAALAFPLASACGARTGLDLCKEPSVRPCETGCGPGTQACVAGSWGSCQVPIATRSCTNDCGQGTQTCADGAWSVCAVADVVRSCLLPCGPGEQTCTDGVWGICDGPEAGPPVLTAQVWDFQDMKPPDFGSASAVGLDPGIVEPTLGADGTPVYAGNPTTPTTTGQADFQEWYHDSFDNLTTTVSLPFGPLTNDPNTYASLNPQFFPVDNQLFGNEGLHNYYFTAALVVNFRYHGGETFRFASDDDSWIFINQKLAVDLGGVHQALAGSIDLDAQRSELGIEVGQTYPMHVFYADRHPVAAVLNIQVPASDFAICSDGGLP